MKDDNNNSLLIRAGSYAKKNNIENPIITVNSIKKTVGIVGESNGARITTEISLFPNGNYVRESSKFSIKDRKRDYLDEVLQLREMGYKQTEIASKLGISQATVSNLLRSQRDIY